MSSPVVPVDLELYPTDGQGGYCGQWRRLYWQDRLAYVEDYRLRRATLHARAGRCLWWSGRVGAVATDQASRDERVHTRAGWLSASELRHARLVRALSRRGLVLS